MGKTCCVPLCPSKPGDIGVKFHELPSNLELREKWLKNISRAGAGGNKWVPNSRVSVCSRHFSASDYQSGHKQKKLRMDTVPTVFQEYPKYMQPKCKERKSPLQRNPLQNLQNQLSATVDMASQEIGTGTELNSSFMASLFGKENYNDICTKIKVNQYPGLGTPTKQMPNPNAMQSQTSTINEVRARHMVPHLQDVHPNFNKQLHNELENQKARNLTLEHDLELLRKKNKNLLGLLKHRNGVIIKLRKKRKPVVKVENNSPKLIEIEKEAENGNIKALILLQQIDAFGKKCFRWSEFCIRMCVLWKSKSARSYNFARAEFVNLPCPSTLQKYVGPSSLETGLTSLAILRLEEEIKILSPVERFCSLIFDEMSIQPRIQYRKQVDKIIGVSENPSQLEGESSQAANRLLCFVLKGLSTNYRIPVAYYLVRQLKGSELADLLKTVIFKVETIGFRVCRLVCDNASVNVKAYEILCKGSVSHKIKHPFRNEDPLFLSYDTCHILKNIRNQFLDDKRAWKNNGHPISSIPIKFLYKNQKNLPIKPVRFLSRKVVYPTNFEKMNVRRAMQIFSNELIAAIKFCKVKNMAGFKEAEETIHFMTLIRKWFTVLNSVNTTHYITSRNPDAAHIWMIDDDRLAWLQTDFLGYLERWKNFCISSQLDVKSCFLTKETHNAIVITTNAAVDCIRYLLESGFHFVLTRKLTSDDVEGIFSAVRASQGRNDQANAVGSIYAIEKILKTGIFSSSGFGNCAESENDSMKQCSTRNVLKRKMPSPTSIELSPAQIKLLGQFNNPPEIKAVTTKNAGVAMISGFVLRLLKDRHSCNQGVQSLAGDKTDAINQLITFQDRGGLMYPSRTFVAFVALVLKVLELSTANHERDALVKSWTETLVAKIPPDCLECDCKDVEHSLKVKNLVLSSICKIYFTNVSSIATEDALLNPKYTFRPQSSKIKKLS